jgi:nucleoside 2-deoxyribosyltransferase
VRVYFAGPLFTPYERRFIDECAARLRDAGITVFVPHEEVVAGAATTGAEIFAVDYEGVRSANAIVALLDGPSIDDGTACEIGLFYGLMQRDESKKGIVGLVTDLRSERAAAAGAGPGLNLFVLGCIEAAGTVCTSIDDVVDVLERWRGEVT